MTKINWRLEAGKALHVAEAKGLLAGPKTKLRNAKVQPALFEAAARRAGTHSPGVVISAALASLATEDDLGSWLAARWGALADADPEILALIEF
jgi:hypothetical protein